MKAEMAERDRLYVETVFMAHGVYEAEMRAANGARKRYGVRAWIDARLSADRRRDEAEATAWAAYLAAGSAEVGS